MSEKYSVLFMRDDTRVRRFRISPLSLKLLMWLQAILILVASLGFYAGYTFWQKSHTLQDERISLQRELRETQVQLERLENMEEILQSNDPEELQALFGTMSIEDSSKEKTVMDLGTLLATEDMQLVSVDNVMLKAMDETSMRLSFDLNNLDTSKTVDGLATVSLLTKDGQLLPTNASTKDLKFTISRFKKVVTSFALADPLTLKDIYALRLTIDVNGKTVLRDLLPVEMIIQ